MATSEADVKNRLQELQTAAKRLVDDNNAMVASAKVQEIEVDGEDGQKEKVTATLIDQERKDRFDSNMESLREIQDEIKRMTSHSDLSDWANAPAGPSVALGANALAEQMKALGIEGPVRGKSLGQLLLQSEEWKQMSTQSASEGIKRSMRMDVGTFRKDVYSDLPTGTPGTFGRVQRDPAVPRPTRSFRVRDLFPVVNTDAATIEFFRVTGFGASGPAGPAGMVAERDGSAFALKPHSNLTIEGATATAQIIAHWEVAHRKVLRNEPVLQGIIENELLYGLELTEDYQILQGSGNNSDLLGILNTPGVQSYTNAGTQGSAGPMIALRHAVTLAFLANYEATGIVLYPTNWEQIEVAQDDNGRFLTFAFPGEGGAPRLWRLPVVVTPAIPENTGLVGAFGLGATLYDREQANIRVAEQHDDYFIRNAVVILAEEELALATKRPESFVKVLALNDVTP